MKDSPEFWPEVFSILEDAKRTVAAVRACTVENDRKRTNAIIKRIDAVQKTYGHTP